MQCFVSGEVDSMINDITVLQDILRGGRFTGGILIKNSLRGFGDDGPITAKQQLEKIQRRITSLLISAEEKIINCMLK